MLEIESNGSKWFGQQPDSIEKLKDVLKNYTLDPAFERCGNFVNRKPQWVRKELIEKYKGCTIIFGNFLALSHVFRIITDDEEFISEMEALINENKKRPEYQEARASQTGSK